MKDGLLLIRFMASARYELAHVVDARLADQGVPSRCPPRAV